MHRLRIFMPGLALALAVATFSTARGLQQEEPVQDPVQAATTLPVDPRPSFEPIPASEWQDLHLSDLLQESLANSAQHIQQFLSQPFFVAEQFTGLEGRYVKLEDTIRSFEELLSGKYDHLPERAFWMVGTIEEAVEKAEAMAAESAA